MVGKLLSLDLKDDGVIVSIVHPGFMRTEMTKGVGFDKYWDDGGAVTPEVAAERYVFLFLCSAENHYSTPLRIEQCTKANV